MKKLFVITNHPYKGWSPEQKEAALRLLADDDGVDEAGNAVPFSYDKIDVVEIPFPNVDPHLDPAGVRRLANETLRLFHSWADAEIMELTGGNCMLHYGRLLRRVAFIIQGEPSLTFSALEILRELIPGVIVATATTERIAEEVVMPDGTVEKRSTFRFVQFRNL